MAGDIMTTALAEPTASSSTPATSENRSSVQLAMELLGGPRVLHRQVVTDEDAHDLVLRGIPAAAMAKLFAGVLTLSTDVVLAAIGVSERSLARRKAAPRTLLAVNESERLWRFAEILSHATRVFGSQAEAEQWLGRPAIGLDQRKPIDLLRTHPGARLVAEYLTRIEHGVYT
jgi:putative toxin-antitoxin system antitoxin component (TIGR02293 family)